MFLVSEKKPIQLRDKFGLCFLFRYLSNADRAHLWDSGNVASVVSFALNLVAVDSVVDVVVGALTVLCGIVQNTSIHKFDLNEANSNTLLLCQTW